MKNLLKFLKYFVFYAMMGGLMFALKLAMAGLPNIHPIGVLIVSLTVIHRAKALIPIYIYVLLEGVFFGFTSYWISYLYVWAILWLFAMMLPKNMPKKIATPVYMVVCGFHGLIFGTLMAPVQALFFDIDVWGWILVGLPFDLIHAVSNFIGGLLIVPLITAFKYSKKILDS